MINFVTMELENLIKEYFPAINPEQLEKFTHLPELYREWNEKINLVSRKDIENLDINHILHSLAIAKYIDFKPGTKIMDLGTGGGLPGIPLAIIFPDSYFMLVDRTGKKITAASDIASRIGLQNVEAIKADAGEIKDKFHFIVSRGVMPQQDLAKKARKLISSENFNSLPNGLISLKGGDVKAELGNLAPRSEIIDLKQYFKEDFFETKKLIYTAI